MQQWTLWPVPRHVTLLGAAGAPRAAAVTRRDDPTLAPEAYHLRIGDARIEIAAASPAGFFYAEQTLAQLQQQCGEQLPAVAIEDSPDFPVRGVMLDISRDKVPTMATLFELVDQLAGWKINQLQLYTEHTFAYPGHEKVWGKSSPMTAPEIRQLDAYCRERFVELVPNQNSFGHMERWLRHPEYVYLAEAPGGYSTPWGTHVNAPFSLYPGEESLAFLRALYAELLPNFGSRLFNVGCDETWDLGQGRSKAEVERVGATRVYLDFLKKVHALVREQGRTMMFWGDIILHQPELVAELPRPIIALEWGYEASSPFDRDGAIFANADIPFYVCPGTSSWCSIAGRSDNCLANLASAAENGIRHGASGYLITDWGDHGHLQYLPVSYLGFVAGAGYSWCYERNRSAAIDEVLGTHAFRDRAGVMGKVALELGNVYQRCGKLLSNASVLFRILLNLNQKQPLEGRTRGDFENSLHAIDAAVAPLAHARMDRPDAQLIIDEFTNAAAMLRYACHRGIATLEGRTAPQHEAQRIVAEHRRLWLARNRAGGLEESAARLATGQSGPTA